MMDDILVYGRDEGEHEERLQRVLQRLERSGMTLNEDKCQFRVKEILFLGHLITEEGIRPDPNKIKAISEMQPPRNRKELKSFLGMVNYLSRFSYK